MTPIVIQTKICPFCQETKIISEFNWRNDNKKFRNECKNCQAKRNKIWRNTNHERQRIYKNNYNARPENKLRRHNQTNKPHIISLHRVKSRAKSRGLDFNLTQADLLIPEKCPISGIPLKRNSNCTANDLPSLDRIDNTKGYIKGNVVICARFINTIKNAGSLFEHELILSYMEENWYPYKNLSPDYYEI